MSSVNGYPPQGSLIPGDNAFSNAVFTDNVKIFGLLETAALKKEVDVKSGVNLTVVTSGTVSPAQLLAGILVISGNFTLPTASTFVTYVSSVNLVPVAYNTFSVDIVPAVDSTVTLNTGNTALVPMSLLFTTATGASTLKMVITDTVTPTISVYRLN